MNDDSLSAAELAKLKQSSLSQESSFKTAGLLHNSASLEVWGESTPAPTRSPRSSRSSATLSKYLQPELNPTPGLDIEPGAKPFTQSSRGRDEQEREK